MVRRVFVEKRKGFDVEAKGLFEDIKNNLDISGLKDIRVINRYDIEGLDEATYINAKTTVFSEPAIDMVYDEKLPENIGVNVFATAYLPGQYDQRADSAAQCIKLINSNANPTVKFARIIEIIGRISEEEFNLIKNYCINPVDSEQVKMEKPLSLKMQMIMPGAVEIVKGFINFDYSRLLGYKNENGFAMSDEDLFFVKDYFEKQEKRDPTITELKVIDTYWSDHCRHTTFLTELKDIEIEAGIHTKCIQEAFGEYLEMRKAVYAEKESDRDITLMDLACIGAKYLKKNGLVNDLDESDEINACSIKTKAVVNGREEDWIVMFKNETHNHPTEIEPFGGAATCLGGAIRDPLSGRVYVYQAMRVTGSADPRTPVKDTIPGKLPQSKITKGAAAGYSSYGNQIGLATGQVAEIYHPGYVAKRMEVGAVIGAAPAANIRRENPQPDDVIILVGGRTGRDGCGGATGSSKEHTEESILNCGAEVQKGNPPVERNIQRLFRRNETTKLIKKCNDFGAGGISVAIGELADSLDVNLDLVLKKYEGLDGTELAISESQERMAVVVESKDADHFLALAESENLEAVTVAKVTNTGRFRMFWKGEMILDLSRDFLNTNGVKQQAKVLIKDSLNIETETETENKVNKNPLDYLDDLNCCSQKGLIEKFDSTIGAGTVIMPLGGRFQLSPSLGMIAKLPVTEGETDTATIMTYGFDPQISSMSPFHGALYAVIDSVTKQVAMGSEFGRVRLTFQEYFERLGGNPESWGLPFASLLGALKVQKELGIPAIGGKDSMSGTFMDINVPPTLISFAVSVIEAKNAVSSELKPDKSHLIYMTNARDENGVIDFNQYKRNMSKISELIKKGKILATNTIGQGGIFVSAAKMALGNKIGVALYNLNYHQLCEADYGALILQVSIKEDIEKIFEGANYKIIGDTTDGEKIDVEYVGSNQNENSSHIKNSNENSNQKHDFDKTKLSISLDEAIKRMSEPLENIFPTRTADFKENRDTKNVETFSYEKRNTRGPLVRIAKPQILIPAFPGTNCEMDSKRAFVKAGGNPFIHIIRNLSEKQLIESIDELEKRIRESQIIMIPGGFSGGDEPDGSAKFITAVFRNPKIMEAVKDLLENRDGLMLGICNGFQALIKLGLVPYGTITEANQDSPTLTYNKIGRHMSCLIQTRIASVKSPWLAGVQVGDIHTLPVSHGEGRFIGSEKLIRSLAENGQIATQYVDFDGKPSMDISFNPNYSAYAIEGITSEDGRVFGKMGHSERIGQNLYKNVPGHYDQKIFESGVNYFK